MNITDILTAALSLSLDAFAVSVCKGLASKEKNIKNALAAGLYFGAAQGIMPLIGHFLGELAGVLFEGIGHIIAFVLLAAIGMSMMHGALREEDAGGASFGAPVMLPLAAATSIDALTAGISFAFLDADIILFAAVTAAVTFFVSFFGVISGHFFGEKFRKGAQFTGGAALVILGIKLLIGI